SRSESEIRSALSTTSRAAGKTARMMKLVTSRRSWAAAAVKSRFSSRVVRNSIRSSRLACIWAIMISISYVRIITVLLEKSRWLLLVAGFRRVIVRGLHGLLKVLACHPPADQAGNGQHYGVQAFEGLDLAFGVLTARWMIVVGRSLSAGPLLFTA